MRRPKKNSHSLADGWQAQFQQPIAIRNGPRFATLNDARSYILSLPKGKQGAWDPAIRSLLKAAETGDVDDIAAAKQSIGVAFMIQGQLPE